jgi:ribonuclease D
MPTAAPEVAHRFIVDQAELDDVVAELTTVDRYALDTEFHRERTYFPHLALVQLAWRRPGLGEQSVVLVDPLAVDVSVLAKVFDADATCVIHAAQQDLDVMTHSLGAVPGRIFDTQIAAGFLGYGTPSLVSLLQGEVGVTPAKGDRLTDWLRRPLTPAQRSYAAGDVVYLLEVHDRLAARLAESGRAAWADDAFDELRRRPVSGAAPDDAWLRLKDARSLRGSAAAIARSVAAWRERRAMNADVPVRQVLPDLAVLGVAQRAPTSTAELAQARGIDERHTRGAIASELLEAVRVGRSSPPPAPPPSVEDLDRQLRPAVTLVSAWLSQLARDERIESSLLATRADIVALLREDDDARLATGWRANLMGDAIRDLVAGRAALTFDGRGRLELVPLERRSPER